MAWFKLHIGVATDAKLQDVAKLSGQPVAFVVAVWIMILDRASEAEWRGSVEGFDCQAADTALQMPEGAGCAIFEAMKAKDMIVNGRVANWEKRQGTRKKVDSETGKPLAPKSNAERQRAYRERQKNQQLQLDTESVTEVTESNVTLRNVTQRNVTRNESVTERNAHHIKEKIRLDNVTFKSIKACPEPQAASGPAPTSQPDLLTPLPEKKPDPPVIEMPVVGNPGCPTAKIFQSDVDGWQEAYPNLDVMAQLRRAKVWLEANPNRRKKNIRKFIVNWLAKEADKPGGPARASPFPQPERKTFAQMEEERWEEMMAGAREYDRQKAMEGKSA